MTSPPQARGPHAKKPELRALTGVRAAAALAVVVSHTHLPATAPEPLKQLASWGYIGVPLFFLLSGFVLAYNYPRLTVREGRRTVLFYIARIARVMPLYWVMVLYCVAYNDATGAKQYGTAFWQNILAVQTWSPDLKVAQGYYNGPGWSIGVEMFFYLLFPFVVPLVALVARRWAARGLVALVAACAVALGLLWVWFVATGRAELPATDPASAHRWLYRNPLPHLPEFVTGLALAFLLPYVRGWSDTVHHLLQTAVLAYTLGLAMFHPTGSPAVSAGSFGTFFLVPFAVGVLSLATGQGWLARFFATRPLVALGAASYALYITHRWLIWQLSTGDIIVSAPGRRGWVALAITLVVLLAVAEGAHRYVEIPARNGIMRVTRRLLGPSRPREEPGPDGDAQPHPTAQPARKDSLSGSTR